jgi:tetratricopeptide (TPR) repeat protein
MPPNCGTEGAPEPRRSRPWCGAAPGLHRDCATGEAALSSEWSKGQVEGQVEGQIHRLTVDKRSMYGRAKLDVLRLRILDTAYRAPAPPMPRPFRERPGGEPGSLMAGMGGRAIGYTQAILTMADTAATTLPRMGIPSARERAATCEDMRGAELAQPGRARGRERERTCMPDRKSRKPDDESPDQTDGEMDTWQPPISLPDRRLMEQHLTAMSRLLAEHEFASIEEANAFLQQQLASGGGRLPPTAPTTPLERAQEVVYEALAATTGARRTALARKALTISPDCADAYVLLAEAATDPRQARQLYEQGVAAGERALGAEAFTRDLGHFWGLVETRPYMRAREGLAEVLWHLGERAAAIEHAQALLRLNPGDNQGIRYLLANWLFAVGEPVSMDALERLLAQYPDEMSAQWAYTHALCAFRRHGVGRQADRALERALQVNPYVPLYLLGVAPFPKQSPAYYGMGDEAEAVTYLAEAVEAWVETEGATRWVATKMLRVAAATLGARSVGPARRRPATDSPAKRKTPPSPSSTPSASSATTTKRTRTTNRSTSSHRPRHPRHT